MLHRMAAMVEEGRAGARRVLGQIGAHPPVAVGGALVVVLALSLALYFVTGTERVRRVLFFPDPETHKLVGEEHFVPRTEGSEESMGMLVKELLLGPASFELGRLLPRSVHVRSVSLRERVLYLDFSTDLVLDAGTVALELADVVQGVANNVYFNFPRLRGLYVFIHGQIPDLPGLDASELAYSKQIVR